MNGSVWHTKLGSYCVCIVSLSSTFACTTAGRDTAVTINLHRPCCLSKPPPHPPPKKILTTLHCCSFQNSLLFLQTAESHSLSPPIWAVTEIFSGRPTRRGEMLFCPQNKKLISLFSSVLGFFFFSQETSNYSEGINWMSPQIDLLQQQPFLHLLSLVCSSCSGYCITHPANFCHNISFVF